MNTHAILLLLLKIGFSLLLALLSLFSAAAQDVPAGMKKLNVKIIKEENGKRSITDTVLVVAADAEPLEVVKRVRADTASLQALRGTKLRMAAPGKLPDPGIHNRLRLAAEAMVADTAVQRLLKDVEIRVRRSGTGPGEEAFRALAESLRQDAAVVRVITSDNLGRFPLDSLSLPLSRRIDVLRGDTLLKQHKLILLDSAFRAQVLPDAGNRQHIIIQNLTGADSSGGGVAAPLRLKIESGHRDTSSAAKAGLEQELELIAAPDRQAATFIIIRKSAKEVTPQEKEQLKAAGAPIETSPKEELKLEELTYYPNPNNGRFTLSFTLAQKGPAYIRVLDSAGSEVHAEQLKKAEGAYTREIDLSGQKPGVYFVQVAQGKRYLTRKIIVQ